MTGASQGALPPFFVLISFSFFLFIFPCGGKGGRRGTQRRFEHRHSVYIYQNFFAFDRAIAIKMCSCNCGGLGLSFLHPVQFFHNERFYSSSSTSFGSRCLVGVRESRVFFSTGWETPQITWSWMKNPFQNLLGRCPQVFVEVTLVARMMIKLLMKGKFLNPIFLHTAMLG